MRHCWVDRIVHLEPGARATGIKAVALAEDEFDGHFPGNPVLPGIYLVEGLAQTAGVLIGRSVEGHKLALLSSIDRARFRAFARPGDVVHLEVELEMLEAASARIRAVATVGEATILSARLTFKLFGEELIIPDLYRPFWNQATDVLLGHLPQVPDE